MITDKMVDKAALAGLNAVRTANGFPSLASIEELPPDDTYRWRQEYRAALEAVAVEIGDRAKVEARQRKEIYLLGDVVQLVQAARVKALEDAAEANRLARQKVIYSGQVDFIRGVSAGHDRANAAICALKTREPS